MSHVETRRQKLRLRDKVLELSDGPFIMGILNATPDSFSDGGKYLSADVAMQQVERMLSAGADFIDIGGESTRPGFEPVDAQSEIQRVIPIVEKTAARFPAALISVDTTKAEVAREALSCGAHMINDVSGLLDDGAMAGAIAASGAACVIMHNARKRAAGQDIVESVIDGWRSSLRLAEQAGVDPERIVLDPGIGFGLSREQDLRILRSLSRLGELGYPLMLGTSRKRITGDLLGLAVDERLEATLATTVAGVQQGVAICRVHDVLENTRAARMAKLIYG